MKRGVKMFTACVLAAGMTFVATGGVAFAAKDASVAGFGSDKKSSEKSEAKAVQTEDKTEETTTFEDTTLSGELAFARCDDYINIRSSADSNGSVVGKVYNNGSVTILRKVGEWYEVQSGRAKGYVKAEYFATGTKAQAIADRVAYNVATVYPEALTIRSGASEDSAEIGTAYACEELEVVDYSGDWMKIALGNDCYGYVNANYVGYDTYYPTAETLEEEQARLDQEWLDYLAQQEAEAQAAQQAQWDAEWQAQQAAQQAQWDAEWQAQQDQWNAEWQAQQNQGTVSETPVQQEVTYETPTVDPQISAEATDAQATADAQYQAYLDAQAAADAATQQPDEQAVLDAAAAAESAYQQYLSAQAEADTAAQAAADAAWLAENQVPADTTTQTADQTYTDTTTTTTTADQTYTDTTSTTTTDTTGADQTYTDTTYTEDTTSTYSSSGQSIVDFATQFVGNPYVWGGTSLTNGADCSGFTQSVMSNFGISIPRTAAAQSGSGTSVSLSDIQPGDLLFYEGSGGIGHVSIYMGNGQVVHASNSRTGITISDYGYRTPVSAKRYW